MNRKNVPKQIPSWLYDLLVSRRKSLEHLLATTPVGTEYDKGHYTPATVMPHLDELMYEVPPATIVRELSEALVMIAMDNMGQTFAKSHTEKLNNILNTLHVVSVFFENIGKVAD